MRLQNSVVRCSARLRSPTGRIGAADALTRDCLQYSSQSIWQFPATTLRRYTPSVMNAIEAAERSGIDLSLVEESLRLTPEQRAIQHQTALEMALQLEAAYQMTMSKRRNDGTQQVAAAPLRR